MNSWSTIFATTATLKWTRPRYAADLHKRMGIDFRKYPVEDSGAALETYVPVVARSGGS